MNFFKSKKIFIIFLLVIFLIFIFGFLRSEKSNKRVGKVEFVIFPGENVKSIGTRLEKEQLIFNRYFFVLYSKITGKDKDFQSGKHLIALPTNFVKIITTLTSPGKPLVQKLTIPPGYTAVQVATLLASNEIIGFEDFMSVVHPNSEVKKITTHIFRNFLVIKDKPKKVGWEGYLFPDTYLINKPATVEDLLKIFIKNMENKIGQKLIKEIEGQGKTIFEVVTMASILEKEANTLTDKKMVAGILWKRLKTGIPLQVEVTLAYVLDKPANELTLPELKINSPYNTYLHSGLPPTPICNPSLESIQAAVYPAESDYWFYLSDKKGNVIYSKDFFEHNIKKAKYLD